MHKLCLQVCLAVQECYMSHAHCTLLQCSAMQFVCCTDTFYDAVLTHFMMLFTCMLAASQWCCAAV